MVDQYNTRDEDPEVIRACHEEFYAGIGILGRLTARYGDARLQKVVDAARDAYSINNSCEAVLQLGEVRRGLLSKLAACQPEESVHVHVAKCLLASALRDMELAALRGSKDRRLQRIYNSIENMPSSKKPQRPSPYNRLRAVFRRPFFGPSKN